MCGILVAKHDPHKQNRGRMLRLVASGRQSVWLRSWSAIDSPEYLKDRRGVPQQLLQNIAVVQTQATKASE
jgi:hypothetical protein